MEPIAMANQIIDPESSWLTEDDRVLFEDARLALQKLKITFEKWVTIGHAVVRARVIATSHGGRNTFQRLLIQQSLSEIVGDKGSLSRLEKIMAHLPDVQAWRFTLTDGQKIDWAAPNTVFRRCPLFNRPCGRPEDGSAPTVSLMSRLKQENEEFAHKIADLEERLAAADAGSLFHRSDSAKDIARVVFDTVGSARKAIETAKEITQLAKAAQAFEATRVKTDRVAADLPPVRG
jgi:hypothetical protein